MAYSRPVVSSDVDLEEFYEKKVKVKETRMKAAQDLINMFKRDFEAFLPGCLFGSLVQQGSTVEGLKTDKPDEFDFGLPILVQHVSTRRVGYLDNPTNTPIASEFHYILLHPKRLKKLRRSEDPRFQISHMFRENPKFAPFLCLDHDLLKNRLKSLLDEFLAKKDRTYSAVSHERKLGFCLEFDFEGLKQTIDADVVPLVRRTYSDGYVAKAPKLPDSHTTGQYTDLDGTYNELDIIWRRSFSPQEQTLWVQITGQCPNLRKAYMIVKTVSKAKYPAFPSYIIKTSVMLMVRKGKKRQREAKLRRFSTMGLYEIWQEVLVQLFTCLKAGRLQHAFRTDINLLQHYNPETIENFRNFLSKWRRNVHEHITL